MRTRARPFLALTATTCLLLLLLCLCLPACGSDTGSGTNGTHGDNGGSKGGSAVDKISAEDEKLADDQFLGVCIHCHGGDDKGKGPAAMALKPPPRDWTDKKWQASVTDEDIAKVIREGGVSVGLSQFMAAIDASANKPGVIAALVKRVRSYDK